MTVCLTCRSWRGYERKEDDLIDFESMYTVVKRLGIRNYKASYIKMMTEYGIDSERMEWER